jgi:hypothetical protein
VRAGALVGLLGIELSTRRGYRMNGPATGRGERRFCVRVQRSFGNCPEYIQARELRLQAEDAPVRGALLTSGQPAPRATLPCSSPTVGGIASDPPTRLP